MGVWNIHDFDFDGLHGDVNASDVSQDTSTLCCLLDTDANHFIDGAFERMVVNHGLSLRKVHQRFASVSDYIVGHVAVHPKFLCQDHKDTRHVVVSKI
ncbi:unnamed protein product [Pseudo-nitzschia multistriata]|uniref:Uncharacterized protein n=1 Tax=Pseudo-nitzschia multistriata TaxID=183589 RepID=A0A448ZSN4_9STRA|nr:unnamed protein product [Pseudo-nitzschia multistriata]